MKKKVPRPRKPQKKKKKRKNFKKISQRQERNIASLFGGDTVVASGALWGAKGDVRTEDYLIEAKYTEKMSYTITADVWEKIQREAIEDRGRIPLMFVDLMRGLRRFVVFSAEDFDCIFDYPVECKKSATIEVDTCGPDENGDYTLVAYFGLKGKHETQICAMLFSDFEIKYGELAYYGI